MATIKDVAALAGVSYTTVSHVINNTRVVAPETREKVEKAIQQLGYEPNVVARGLRKGKSKTIGVVSISSSDIYFSEILQGLQEKSWEEGYGVYISYSDLCGSRNVDVKIKNDNTFCDREQKLLEDLVRRDIQGLILNSLLPDGQLKQALASLKIPFILFQREIEGLSWDTYLSDDYQGTREAVNYLLERGHTRIALVEGFGYESHTIRYRKKAWLECLLQSGIEPDPHLVRNGAYDINAAYTVTRALLQENDPPTAILYYSDTMALAGIRAAADMHIKVPDDLAVIGYDNLHLGEITVPRLTSVNQMTYQIGKDMVERLIKRIDNPDIEPVLKTYPQNLVIRESAGQ